MCTKADGSAVDSLEYALAALESGHGRSLGEEANEAMRQLWPGNNGMAGVSPRDLTRHPDLRDW